MDVLIRNIERIVGASISLHPFPPTAIRQWRDAGEQLPAALCLAGDNRIFVLYREDTTPAHQRHSILHELGHICARHLPPVGETPTEELGTVPVARAKHRSFYDDSMERAAEAFAYTMESRIGLMRANENRPTDPTYQEAVDRYGSILEG
ncbi:ImmA/IrrE family metallo-endopeptidase [Lentzea sp. BCCO 10_0798]|uniref:ImmA/IrrE family metallo-endopeptidase n=1 Tax=Lentzea kristufekii TaxID=3095430 RepID=A0ABU4U7W8_9PSEU|nr:ImmA/IrrE family metallo-endopeptidase [Lentzea sp. BCCO 10_0798]MDX8056674.1 ImmA/IrrE family metallo-endopeptidase [Lentzea sp. BCCO 10_0798]